MSARSAFDYLGNLLDSADSSAAAAIEKAGAGALLARDDEVAVDADAVSDAVEPSVSHGSDSSPTAFTRPSTNGDAKDAEIASLKEVWNQARSELNKTKAILRQREQVYRTNMGKLKDEVENGVQGQHDRLLERCERAEKALENDKARNEQLQTDALEKVNLLAETEFALRTERDSLLEELRATTEEHNRRIQDISAEFNARQRELQEQSVVHSGSLQHLRDRESDLTNDRIEYSTALARAQVELQEKSAELKKVAEKLNWATAQGQQLRNALEAKQRELVGAQESAAAAAKELQEGVRVEGHRLRELEERFGAKEHEMQATVADLRVQLQQSHAGDHQAKIVALEQKCANLTDHLLQRQSEIERTGSVASTLSLQLDRERSKYTTLDAERRRLEQRLSDISTRADVDVESGMPSAHVRRRRRHGTNPTVHKVLEVIDRAVLGTSNVLRRSPTARIAIVLYVLLLHIWVLFVLSHYMQHEVQLVTDTGPHDLGDDLAHLAGKPPLSR